MTIASEITRLQWAKADIKTAIESKWVSVWSNLKLNNYSSLIQNIQTWNANLKNAPIKVVWHWLSSSYYWITKKWSYLLNWRFCWFVVVWEYRYSEHKYYYGWSIILYHKSYWFYSSSINEWWCYVDTLWDFWMGISWNYIYMWPKSSSKSVCRFDISKKTFSRWCETYSFTPVSSETQTYDWVKYVVDSMWKDSSFIAAGITAMAS